MLRFPKSIVIFFVSSAAARTPMAESARRKKCFMVKKWVSRAWNGLAVCNDFSEV